MLFGEKDMRSEKVTACDLAQECCEGEAGLIADVETHATQVLSVLTLDSNL